MVNYQPSTFEVIMMCFLFVIFSLLFTKNYIFDDLNEPSINESLFNGCYEGCVFSSRIVWQDNATHYDDTLSYMFNDCINDCRKFYFNETGMVE